MTWELLTKILIVALALLFVSEIVARIFWRGEESGENKTWGEWKGEMSDKWIHNGDRGVVQETVGWRPDPHNQNDGFTQGESLKDGTPTYYKVVREPKGKYKDVPVKDLMKGHRK